MRNPQTSASAPASASATPSPSPSASAPDTTRVRLPRVRTGCVSCKAAHVKCDEAKPVCHRCHRAQRRCTYPAATDSKHKSHDASSARALGAARKPLRPLLPASESPGSSAQRPTQSQSSREVTPSTTAAIALLRRPQQFSDLDDPNAALYFDRFRAQAARYRSATMDNDDFWFRTLLRETTYDKGILAAVLSLGALAQAYGDTAEHVSLFSVNTAAVPDTRQKSYRDAVKYYSLSISRLRERLDDPNSLHEEPSSRDCTPGKQGTSRSVLISSILYSAFELMHGNSASADRIVAKSMSILRKKLLHKKHSAMPTVEDLSIDDDESSASSPADPPYAQIGRPCDDDGIEEAEWLLIRRAAIGSLYAPMRPVSREAIHQLPDLDFLAGSKPPPTDATCMTFWKLYFRWLPLAALWYIRATSVRLPLSSHGYVFQTQQEYAKMRAHRLSQEPFLTLTVERETLRQQMLTWETAVLAKLDTSVTVDEASLLSQILANCKNLRYQLLTLFDSIMDPVRRAEMCSLGCEIIAMGEGIFTVLPGISEGRDEMRESLTAVAVLMSQNCRESADIRRRAFSLLRQLIDARARWDAKGLVMGISTLIDIEEGGRDTAEGMIPVFAQWEWTYAKWDDDYTELEVLFLSRATTVPDGTGGKVAEGGVPIERRMILKPADFGY